MGISFKILGAICCLDDEKHTEINTKNNENSRLVPLEERDLISVPFLLPLVEVNDPCSMCG